MLFNEKRDFFPNDQNIFKVGASQLRFIPTHRKMRSRELNLNTEASYANAIPFKLSGW